MPFDIDVVIRPHAAQGWAADIVSPNRAGCSRPNFQEADDLGIHLVCPQCSRMLEKETQHFLGCIRPFSVRK